MNLRQINENEDLVIFEKFHDPGPAKKFKKCENFQKNFWDLTTKKALIYIPNIASGSFGEF